MLRNTDNNLNLCPCTQITGFQFHDNFTSCHETGLVIFSLPLFCRLLSCHSKSPHGTSLNAMFMSSFRQYSLNLTMSETDRQRERGVWHPLKVQRLESNPGWRQSDVHFKHSSLLALPPAHVCDVHQLIRASLYPPSLPSSPPLSNHTPLLDLPSPLPFMPLGRWALAVERCPYLWC